MDGDEDDGYETVSEEDISDDEEMKDWHLIHFLFILINLI